MLVVFGLFTAGIWALYGPLKNFDSARSLMKPAGGSGTASEGWPQGPFRTKGRHIVDARGDVVTWAGVNWPMSGMK
jgi:hypothetical protein